LIEKSEYGKYDHNEALIIKDYTMLLKEIINTNECPVAKQLL
jgi:hypothetical protein